MKVAYGVGLSVLLALGTVAGCDDDRELADLGVGGVGDEPGGAGPTAGAPETGGADQGLGGQSGAGGEGGARPAECPIDYLAADGTACPLEGQICSDGSNDPCGFGNSLVCFGGEWQRQEAFPAPCGGAGGAGGAEAAGSGGAEAAAAGGSGGAG